MMKNVILIGMPGCGKSTIGVVLAKVLGYRFIDGDLLIQEQEGKLLSEIIAERGNEGFLEIENQVNRDLQADRSVISPGGSVIYGKEAMEHYQEKYAQIVIEEDGLDVEGTLEVLVAALKDAGIGKNA